MMMQRTDRHALCKLLAKWAGVEIIEMWPESVERWWATTTMDPNRRWDPLTDANQMEMVKAGLRKKGIGYSIWWKPVIYHATLFRPGVEGDPLGVGMHHESEATALALAIQAMEQGK